MEDKKEKTTKGGAKWQEVTIGGVTGIALGVGSTLLMGSTPTHEGMPEESVDSVDSVDSVESVESNETETQEPVDNGYAQMASDVNDDMSFNEAFAAARAEVGPGGVFEWHGSIYSTYYASEWNAMDSAAREEFYSTIPWYSASHHHTVYSTTTDEHHTEDVAEGGETGEEHAGTSDGTTASGSTETADPEIEIIGVEHANLDGEHDSIIGAASVNGQAVYFVDIDGTDDQFDVMMADLNGDSDIDETEVFDITDQHMSVSHFEELAHANSGSNSEDDNLDEMYANNDNLPDYVNDVDPGNID